MSISVDANVKSVAVEANAPTRVYIENKNYYMNAFYAKYFGVGGRLVDNSSDEPKPKLTARAVEVFCDILATPFGKEQAEEIECELNDLMGSLSPKHLGNNERAKNVMKELFGQAVNKCRHVLGKSEIELPKAAKTGILYYKEVAPVQNTTDKCEIL